MKPRLALTLLLLAITLCIMGCATDRPANRVNHVVLCWLKEPGDTSGQDRIIETSKTFREIPGLIEVRVGKAIPSDRPIVDDSFDVCITMTFANTEDMAAYLAHPDHKKAVDEVLQPLVQKIVVYDFME